MIKIFFSFLKDRRKQMFLFLGYFGIIALILFLYSARLDMVFYLSNEEMYQRISDTLTVLTTGGELGE